MVGRSKPPWAVFEGGPLDGERKLLQPDMVQMKALVRYSASAMPGMRVPNEYRVIGEFKTVVSDVWKVGGSVPCPLLRAAGAERGGGGWCQKLYNSPLAGVWAGILSHGRCAIATVAPAYAVDVIVFV